MMFIPRNGSPSVSRRLFARGCGRRPRRGRSAPALAQQTSETVKWRLTSSFPKSLDTLFGAATHHLPGSSAS